MWPLTARSEDPPDLTPVRWLRVLKLLLTVILLAIAVWNAIAGGV